MTSVGVRLWLVSIHCCPYSSRRQLLPIGSLPPRWSKQQHPTVPLNTLSHSMHATHIRRSHFSHRDTHLYETYLCETHMCKTHTCAWVGVPFCCTRSACSDATSSVRDHKSNSLLCAIPSHLRNTLFNIFTIYTWTGLCARPVYIRLVYRHKWNTYMWRHWIN